ncbi:hypothetical protein [Methylobacter sp. YRD-M1]|uniref:hypothetical protein n=1 Tax=Methylobacter sp. YRD-M1 TaxID=2911520 RepID=UPI00227C750C|nr:hypothetical protein [Methylobacter sp. YRD-M1]WAK01867.1 hypothetical protein LZ558_18940 [Methylobacter sp. YRD-M1]
MAFELFDTEYTPDGTINQYFYDEDQDVMVINTISDITGLLERNKQIRNNGSNGFNKTRTARLIADIDATTYHRLLVEHHIDVLNKEDRPRLKKWLRDRDNRAFTTVDGKF